MKSQPSSASQSAPAASQPAPAADIVATLTSAAWLIAEQADYWSVYDRKSTRTTYFAGDFRFARSGRHEFLEALILERHTAKHPSRYFTDSMLEASRARLAARVDGTSKLSTTVDLLSWFYLMIAQLKDVRGIPRSKHNRLALALAGQGVMTNRDLTASLGIAPETARNWARNLEEWGILRTFRLGNTEYHLITSTLDLIYRHHQTDFGLRPDSPAATKARVASVNAVPRIFGPARGAEVEPIGRLRRPRRLSSRLAAPAA
jgi:hypothetical protein